MSLNKISGSVQSGLDANLKIGCTEFKCSNNINVGGQGMKFPLEYASVFYNSPNYNKTPPIIPAMGIMSISGSGNSTIDMDITANGITVSYGGFYLVTASLTFFPSANELRFQLGIGVDGVIPVSASAYCNNVVNTANGEHSMNLSELVLLNPGQEISIMGGGSSGSLITIEKFRLCAVRIS